MIIVEFISLIVGFVLLIKGADIFVDGASSTAQNFKISKMLIGLTIVAFGTSAPEFAVSVSALANRSSDIVLGNVIGSCILNILLILGVASVIKPIKIGDNTVKKELPLCLLISTLLVVLLLDVKLGNGSINEITRSDALVIILFFTVFVYYLITLLHKSKESKEKEKPKYKLFKSLLFVAIGLGAIVLGSNMVVNSSIEIALYAGISQRVISLTIVAFGTSLPELVTTIVSSRKGEQELLLGNIIGSNIFNICVVLGVPVAIFGSVAQTSFTVIDLIYLFGSALVLYIFSSTNKTISRCEGIIMLVAFAVYYVLVFL